MTPLAILSVRSSRGGGLLLIFMVTSSMSFDLISISLGFFITFHAFALAFINYLH